MRYCDHYQWWPGRLDRERASMLHTALDSNHDLSRSTASMIARQRDLGLQMRLFPANAPEGEENDLDLRVADDLAGMYYIG